MDVRERLRATRKERRLSLNDVASQAGISVSTLSRIETGKQALELQTFLLVARILRTDPRDLLGEGVDLNGIGVDPLVRQLASLRRPERIEIWKQLSSALRERAPSSSSSPVHRLAMEVEELLAQVDFLRAEIEAVRDRLDE